MKSIYKNLLITSFFISLATTAFPVFLPVYFKELGLSNFEIGASLALLYLTSAILSVFVGYFEEKISKKKILIFSYFGYILLPIFYLNAANLISIFLVRIYDGIVSSLRYVSKYSILESKKSDETGINISLNEALSSVGCLLGPFIAGIVASYYGINMIFIISSIILFFTALYSARMLKFTKNNNFILKKLFHKKTLFLSVLKKLFRKKSLMTLSLIFLLFAIIDHSKFMIIILYMKSLNFNNFFIGLAGSSFFLFLFLFEIFYGYLQKKFKKNKFLALGLLLYSFAYLLFPFAINIFSILFLISLISLGIALIKPTIFSNLVTIEKDNSNIGTGIIFLFSNTGAAIGLIISGLITQVSFELFFIFGSMLLFVTGLISLFYLKIKPHWRGF